MRLPVLALLLAGCGSVGDADVTEVTPKEAEALRDAAEMLGEERKGAEARDGEKRPPIPPPKGEGDHPKGGGGVSAFNG